MLVLIAESLIFNTSKVWCLMVFQLNDTNRLIVNQNGTISLLGTDFVLQLRSEIVVGRRIDRVTQHLHKQFTQKTFLKLFLLDFLNIRLDILVQEITCVLSPWLSYLLFAEQVQILLDYISL